MKLTNLTIDNYTLAAREIRSLNLPAGLRELALECLSAETRAEIQRKHDAEQARINKEARDKITLINARHAARTAQINRKWEEMGYRKIR